jgi:hypothetical protein
VSFVLSGGAGGLPCSCLVSSGDANHLRDLWKLPVPRVTLMWSKVGIVWFRLVPRGQIRPKRTVVSPFGVLDGAPSSFVGPIQRNGQHGRRTNSVD